MRTIVSPYEFYEMPETERISLVGDCLKEERFDTLYFPVCLSSEQFNYGISQGLLFVTPIRKVNDKKYFKVGVFSPDDLDLDLCFKHPLTEIRQDVLEYIRKMNKKNVTYGGMLENIQNIFGGTID
jgi:hypothetical protein